MRYFSRVRYFCGRAGLVSVSWNFKGLAQWRASLHALILSAQKLLPAVQFIFQLNSQ